ncbi:Hypp6590 [Branchiostoma lanceolatum]|uniref:Hypp6590 protein n=1 Tax=Branchiostoma lanceolatum TaxID=7740 RepID=A0A8K0E5C6_BRALA|nr:Hypp6590 [Branchiostoma lanceolatum]
MYQKYSCFKLVDHLHDELKQYVAPGDDNFLPELNDCLPEEAEVLVRFAMKEGLLKEASVKKWSNDKKVRKALQQLPKLFKGSGAGPTRRNVDRHAKGKIQLPMENDNVEDEAFLAVREGPDDCKAFVIVQGKSLAVAESFVALMGALYCFQLPHHNSLAPAMVFLEYHILQDRLMNENDLSTLNKKAEEK